MLVKKKAPATEILQLFSRRYREEVGVEYVPTWGRDLKMFGELLGLFSVDKLGELIERYFTTPRKTYSIPFFKCAINDLQQADIRENKKYNKAEMINPDSDRFF